MNMCARFYLLILLSVSINCFSQLKQDAVIQKVSVREFDSLMDSLQDEIVVDLRTPDELKNGRIPGALAIDFFGPEFETSIHALDKQKVYLLYCAGGGRSAETAELMAKSGFKRIYNLEQGFNGWAKQKMPISRE
jgi:rhodanese-related sulfurtransferase